MPSLIKIQLKNYISIVFISLFPYLPVMTLTLAFDIKINKVHPLIMDNKCAKFDQNTINNLISIMFMTLFLYLPIETLVLNL